MDRAPFHSHEPNDPGRHGSSLTRPGDRLDAERAASMADEGGAAGALTDALEQAGASQLSSPRSRVLPRWVPWAIAAAGIAGFLAAWLRSRE
jgi:hypothetical protein